MDIASIAAFVEVAERQSFSAAAQALRLTQPAVSKRVQALEKGLGATLFDRIGKNIRLTEAGQHLLPRARRLLSEIQEIQRGLRDLSGRIAGTLTIGTSHHIGLHRLPPVLEHFVQRYPEVILDLRFMDSEAACNAAEAGDIDLGIVTLPPELPKRLQLIRLWNDPLRFVVGRKHPLARAPATTPEKLMGYPAVLPGRGTFTRQILESALAHTGLRIAEGLSTNYLETLKMLVVVGLGWSLLPATMVDEELCELDVGAIRPSRSLGVVHHRGRSLSNAAQAMVKTCIEAADAGNRVG